MSGLEYIRLKRQIKAVEDSPSDRLDELVRATGLDPTSDLRFGNWSNFDLSDANLRGFNFTGANLSGARFHRAHIATAIFDQATYDLASLHDAADFGEFLKQEIARPYATRRLPAARRLKDLEVIRDTPLCPELIVVPIGDFLMGSVESDLRLDNRDDRAFNNEIVKGQGKRPMRIAQRFALGRYPVTFDEYDAFLDATKKKRGRGRDEATDPGRWGRGRRPVINVSWNDAQVYCDWLNRMTGLRGEFGYRLPSEAEWEYACRAGTQTRRWWGDSWDPTKANGAGSFEDHRTSPVGHYPANRWGLHDMIGNVYEWCADSYADNILNLPPDGTPYQDSVKPKQSFRVLRGGSWGNDPQNLRSADRSRNRPDLRDDDAGFRVARTL